MNDEKPVIFDKMLNSKNLEKNFLLCIHVELNVYKIDSKNKVKKIYSIKFLRVDVFRVSRQELFLLLKPD